MNLRILTIFALMLMLFILMLSGCVGGKIDDKQIADAEEDSNMFMVVSNEYRGQILVDKVTRVMYWLSTGAYNAGTLTVLVNPNGAPRVWKEQG